MMVLIYATSTTAENDEGPIELIFLSPGADYVNNIDNTTTGCRHQPAWKALNKSRRNHTTADSSESSESNESEDSELTTILHTAILPEGFTWSLPKDGVFLADRESHILTITLNRTSKYSQIRDKKFPPLLFYHFCRLKSLNMPSSELKNIEAQDFANANELLSLNLSHNIIDRIDSDTFVNMSLNNIDLSFNEIESIDECAIQLTRFEYLFLQNNRLKCLKIDKFVFTTLEDTEEISMIAPDSPLYTVPMYTCDLSNNQLTNENNDSIGVRSEQVYFQNNDLDSLIIFPQTKLLDASNNRISKLILVTTDDRFQLNTLQLSHNRLTSVSDFTKFRALNSVDLSFNWIETLETDVFSTMEYLTKVLLNNNRFKHFQFSVFNLNQLEYLDISHNNINEFEDILESPSLKELHIQSNILLKNQTIDKQKTPKLEVITQ